MSIDDTSGRRTRISMRPSQWILAFVACVSGLYAFGWLRSGPTPIVAAQSTSQWTPQTPAPFIYQGADGTSTNGIYHSGRVASIAVDPRDPRRWLVGVGNGGVWETSDAGDTFRPITDDVPTLATGAVAFAPSNPDIVYVGTGETGGATSVARVGVGILRSTNGGATWSLLGQSTFTRAAIRWLRVDPRDPNIVLVASQRSAFGRDGLLGAPLVPPFGVYRTTDGGNSWTRTLPGQATALEMDASNFSRQYAAIADQRPGDFEESRSPNGVYRSTNGGVTWSRIEGPWGTDLNANQTTGGRIELAIAPSNANILYASVQKPLGTGGNNDLLGLFRTDNAWSDTPTWVQVPTGSVVSDSGSGYCPTKCGYAHVISVDPLDANTVFAGGERYLWRCTSCNTAPTWVNVTADRRVINVHPDFHALSWAGGRLLAGNDGGVFSSTDAGATWRSHNRTLTTTKFYQGALHPADASMLLGSARDFSMAIFRESTGWRVLPQSATGEWGEGEVAISSLRPDTDWMGAHIGAMIQRTTDGGRTTLQVDAGIDKTGAAFTAPVRKCPANDNVFLAGTLRLWRTNDFFSSAMPSWSSNSSITQVRTGPDPLNQPGAILSIAFVESDRNCNTYAFGTRGGDVRLTRDGGGAWSDLDPSRTLPARPINGLAIDPSNANRMFAVISSYDLATPTKPGHIFRTDNALSSTPTWTRVGPPDVPFSDMPFNVVAIDPREPRRVYAGSENGLWQSVDGGGSWTKVGRESGLPPAAVNDIQINPVTNRTVIFTYGRGAFELSR